MKLRWGIMSSAWIAIHKVIPGIQQSELGEVTAIASRGIAKAEEAAANLGIAKAYGSYEELLADADIDAVYIPLPNHMHKEWTIKAAEAGKHVLCEKPIALTAAEAQEMIDACRKAGVVLAEAFMYRHHPRYTRIQEIIASGEIGELRAISGAFTFNNAADANNVRYKAEWGGGSLYDVGCYPISAARLLLGQEPVAATMHAFFSEQHDNVDMMSSGILEFPGNIALTFDCGMWAAERNRLEVLGTEGRIELPNAFAPGENDQFIVYAKDGERVEGPFDLNTYSLQADRFAKVVRGEAEPAVGEDDPRAGMIVLEACLKSARTKSRVEL
ncbi:Gfo/Idh/MocA family protein [Paenibacillus sp. NEAU-GSW1]|uniref:Gfo/Idh/MocA family protein n=1 Tax=Paenibacillus sp. NEAU-GSW1 TaxID=2682486 RepID=UPI0012E17FD1|nr:Gfo/Idh/MocA family oxidoreductase [Paenibacillus sp. NEAU-GSW1]MUT67547.1 gfo/Idh/MocA family oxidoreductase [Paenibacillus sp. NEAU-GSW1]